MKKICLIAIATMCIVNAFAQDIHFSQFYASPLLLNPAKTGFFDATYRATAIYRNQWNSVTIPYKTIGGSIDAGFLFGSESRSIFGAGVVVASDVSGDAFYSTTETNLCMAANFAVGEKKTNFLSVGAMAGYARSHYDYTLLTFDEEFDNGSNNEAKPATQISYTDFSAGVEYNFLRSTTNYNIGVAMFHINQPNITYYHDANSIIYRKIILNGGFTKKLSPTIEIYPRFAVSLQGPYREYDFGGFTRMNLDKGYSDKHAIYFGATYRVSDAVIPNVRFELGNYSLSISYDVNVSKLTQASHVRGGPEIAILYTGKTKGYKPKDTYCPRF